MRRRLDRTAVRATTAVAAASALALTLAACGGGGGTKDNGSGGSKGGSTAPTVQLPKLNGQKLQVAAVWTGPEQENFIKVLDEFEKRTGAKVDFVPTRRQRSPPSSAPRSRAASRRTSRCCRRSACCSSSPRRAGSSRSAPRPRRSSTRTTRKGWQDLGAYKGKQYGVYFKAANKSLVWYNTTGLRERGRQGAEDLEGLRQDRARPSPTRASTPVSVGGADGWTLTDWFENIYLSQAGPEKYDQLAKHKIKWTDPSRQAGADHARPSCSARRTCSRAATHGALQTEFPTSVTQTFTGGDTPKAAMVFEGDFVAVNIAPDQGQGRHGRQGLPVPGGRRRSPRWSPAATWRWR